MSQSKSYISTPSNIMFEAWSLGIPGNVIPIQKDNWKWENLFKKLKIVNLLLIIMRYLLSQKEKLNLNFQNLK